MEIKKDLHMFLWNDPTQNNCNTYLLLGEKKILIDPGHFHLFSHVITQVELMGIDPYGVDLVLVSHFHPDHMEGVKRFKEGTFTAIYYEEYYFLKDVLQQTGMPLERDFQILLKEGDLIAGDISLQIIHTPGHSPGHMCIYWPKYRALFSGDLLFQGGFGRTDIIGGDSKAIKESLERLEGLEVEILLPGHGLPLVGKQECKRNLKWVKETLAMYL